MLDVARCQNASVTDRESLFVSIIKVNREAAGHPCIDITLSQVHTLGEGVFLQKQRHSPTDDFILIFLSIWDLMWSKEMFVILY